MSADSDSDRKSINAVGSLPQLPHDDEKFDDKNNDKVQEVEVEDEIALERANDLQERILKGEANIEEYRVENGHDVAIKVLSTRDDYELPVVTFRMIFLGLGFSAFGSVLAQLYYFKPQTLSVSQGFLLIMIYFVGKAWERVIPTWGPLKYINPGKFNIKEHAAAYIMAYTASGSATAIQVISVQDLYYGNEVNPGIAIFTLLASQLIGYAFAGLLQEALVYPSMTFWPTVIMPANMFQALHFDGGLGSKRTKMFWIVFGAIFCWEIFPQWIFPWLTGISIFCLIDHSHSTIRNIFGGASNNEGMGILSLCLDWNLLGSSSLYVPLWTQLNEDIGICFTYILMSAVYYGNIWNAKTFPFMSQALFNATGGEYDQSLLLTDSKFDPVKYAEIGPAYFSATNVLSMITQNLAMGATSVHVFLFYWDDIKPFLALFNPWHKGERFIHDEHFTAMKRYKQIPKYWWGILLAVAYGMAQATDYTGHSNFTWWQLTVILVLSLFFTTVYSTTSALLGFKEFGGQLDGFYQMITSYMAPGDPVANMYGALYGSQPTVQGIKLLADLKLGQYCKIPPRVNFLVQILGCIVGAILNYVMALSIIKNQRADLLSIAGTRLWSGQNAQSYNYNAIAWGALGPEMFAPGKPYYWVPAALGLGALFPIPGYILHRMYPKNTFFANFNTGIVTQYACYLSVGINTSVNTSMVIGIISQWFVRRRFPRAFTKYNYIVAGALDGGTQVISFILNLAVFGAVGTPHLFPEWWGNDLKYSADRCKAPG
ncbi:OPT superfamily oligopeptide transporter [Cylindrobasidium torrendii FP15055 ss-10]|uniref:OPT superfamily oligopeptide transporter n=1 Tax=Cylindrobasidium torrendii FP15055 ss-10 TaxID=1314674 RepID=A0A0D7B892_9AGAR|nr:OPT superfamily oligopeptide transporter [Cylindrobasidium torrendii FP15055 ss-10]